MYDGSSILHLVGDWLLDGLPSILGAALSWFFFFFIFAPRIRLASDIECQANSDNAFSATYPIQYRLKLRNRSLHIPGVLGHDLCRVSIRARLTIPFSETRRFFDIPVEGEIDYEIPSLPIQGKGKTGKMLWRKCVLCYRHARNLNDIEIKSLGLRGDFSLQDILAIPGATLYVYVSGTSQHTGQVKFFSATYHAKDIKPATKQAPEEPGDISGI